MSQQMKPVFDKFMYLSYPLGISRATHDAMEKAEAAIRQDERAKVAEWHPTCETCRHWKLDSEYDGLGSCDADDVPFGQCETLFFPASFGCIYHESKPQEDNE